MQPVVNFASRFVLDTPAPKRLMERKFAPHNPLHSPYKGVTNAGGDYVEITSVLDGNDGKVAEFLDEKGISYRMTLTGRAALRDDYLSKYPRMVASAAEDAAAANINRFREAAERLVQA